MIPDPTSPSNIARDERGGSKNSQALGAREVLDNATPESVERLKIVAELLTTVFSPLEIAPLEQIELGLRLNSDPNSAFHSIAVITDPDDAKKALAVASGSLTRQRSLIVDYAAVRPGFERRGLGRSAFKLLFERANSECQARHGDNILLMAGEASGASPEFWRKLGFRVPILVGADGERRRLDYIQPVMRWDLASGSPIAEGYPDRKAVQLNGKSEEFPGIREAFMIKSVQGQEVSASDVLSLVRAYLEYDYFIQDPSTFLTETSLVQYQAWCVALIDSYLRELASVTRVELI